LGKNLAHVISADSGKGAEDAVLDVMLAGVYGVETCAPCGVPIMRDASSWTDTKNPDSAKSLAESFSVLGCWAVERLLRDFLAAERLAKSGADPEVTDAVIKGYQTAFAEFVASRNFANDSLTKGLTAPLKPEVPFVVVVSEPTWRMNDGMFGFNDRVLAAQTAMSLRKQGRNVALLDVRKLLSDGIAVEKAPVMIVFAQKVSAYYSLQPKMLTERLVKYRKAGGKIIWIGGGLPDHALCDFSMEVACRADVGKGYDYCWTRLPVDRNAYTTLTLKVEGHATRKLERNPSFHAGWHIPSNVTFFKPEAIESVMPLATVRDQGNPILVGGAWPKKAPSIAYFPVYAFYPFLWTKETPTLVPFERGLDSQGLDSLETAFLALQVERLLKK